MKMTEEKIMQAYQTAGTMWDAIEKAALEAISGYIIGRIHQLPQDENFEFIGDQNDLEAWSQRYLDYALSSDNGPGVHGEFRFEISRYDSMSGNTIPVTIGAADLEVTMKYSVIEHVIDPWGARHSHRWKGFTVANLDEAEALFRERVQRGSYHQHEFEIDDLTVHAELELRVEDEYGEEDTFEIRRVEATYDPR